MENTFYYYDDNQFLSIVNEHIVNNSEQIDIEIRGSVNSLVNVFNGANNLIDADLSKVDVNKINNVAGLFRGCQKLENVNVTNGDTSNLVYAEDFFGADSKLKDIKGINNGNVSKVRNLDYFFNDTRSVLELDLSNWNTSNVRTMHNIFADMRTMNSLNVSTGDIKNVGKMNGCFFNDRSLTELNLSNGYTYEVQDMSNIFYNCISLQNLYIPNGATQNVVNMSCVFANCYNLTSLDVSNGIVDKVINFRSTFQYCKNLTTINISNGNVTNKMTNMTFFLQHCENINTPIDLTKGQTNSCNNLVCTFDSMHSVPSFNLSTGNTLNVENAAVLFYSCGNATDININSGELNNCKNTGKMFFNCSNLINLSGNKSDLSNTINIENMFYHCNNLSSKSGNTVANIIPYSTKFTNKNANYGGFDYSNENIQNNMSNEALQTIIDKGGKIPPKIVTFEDGTDKEIAAMLEAHYAGDIDIEDYWHVGDTRIVHIDATNSGTCDHVAQDMTMVIMDFNHDDLSTPINKISKAAVSVGFREIMGNNDTSENEYYWGSSHSPVNDNENYSISPLRTWLNNGLLNALPSTFSSLIKEVDKKNLQYHTKTDGAPLITKDKIWLLSYPEIFGTTKDQYYLNNADPSNYEGEQYQYFATSSNRIKYLNKNGEKGSDYGYWLRSPSSFSYSGLGYNWCLMYSHGDTDIYIGDSRNGLAPAFCL